MVEQRSESAANLTDRERVGPMTNDEALANPDAPPLTADELDEMEPIAIVRRLRLSMGRTQTAFAERFGFRVDVVHDWEQRRSPPDRTERVLLAAIEVNPD